MEDYSQREGARLGMTFLRREVEPAALRDGEFEPGRDGLPTAGQTYLRGAEELLAAAAFNVLLQHNPDVFPVAAAKGFPLTISGHTHGGQVRVEILRADLNISRFFTPYVDGLYQKDGASIFVSRGIGTIGLPTRLGAPPEVAVLKLCAPEHGLPDFKRRTFQPRSPGRRGGRRARPLRPRACLGDMVGYGAEPNYVAEWMRLHATAAIRGNHDKMCSGLECMEGHNGAARAAAEWTRTQLTPANAGYLASLPRGPLRVDDFDLVHGSPLDEDEYLIHAGDAGRRGRGWMPRSPFSAIPTCREGFCWPGGESAGSQPTAFWNWSRVIYT